jgi:Fe2+ transport system protein FeoA
VNISDLNTNDKAEITAVNAKGEIRRRLLDMGLVKGVSFTVIRRAPLGDPIEILIKKFNLSLRKEEAEQILVKLSGDQS